MQPFAGRNCITAFPSPCRVFLPSSLLPLPLHRLMYATDHRIIRIQARRHRRSKFSALRRRTFSCRWVLHTEDLGSVVGILVQVAGSLSAFLKRTKLAL